MSRVEAKMAERAAFERGIIVAVEAIGAAALGIGVWNGSLGFCSAFLGALLALGAAKRGLAHGTV